MKRIFIKTEKVKMEAELNETKTAQAIWDVLPVACEVNTWGEEIYFEIPVKLPLENAVGTVKEGDLGYWPAGYCFCIFFGLTPISTPAEIKPASPVNIIGKLLGNPKDWKKVIAGEWISVEKIST